MTSRSFIVIASPVAQHELLRSQTLHSQVRTQPRSGTGHDSALFDVQTTFFSRYANRHGGVSQCSIKVTTNACSCSTELSSPVHVKFRSHAAHKPHAGLDSNRASTGVIWYRSLPLLVRATLRPTGAPSKLPDMASSTAPTNGPTLAKAPQKSMMTSKDAFHAQPLFQSP
jgi:hypothetical protein